MLALLQGIGALVLFLSPDTYRETYGREPRICGDARPSTRVVRVFMPPPPGCPPVEVTLRHEYCHLVVNKPGHGPEFYACWTDR